MTVLKQLGVVLLGCAAAAAMVTMGVWQLRVYTAQGAEAAAQRAAGPAVPLPAVAPVNAPVRDGYGRLVRFSGRYLPERQLLVPMPNDPSMLRVVTGFQIDGATVLAVVRGVVAAGTATADVPSPPGGSLSQEGVLLPSEESPSEPVTARRLRSVRMPELAQQWPEPLVDGFVVLSAHDAAAQDIQPAPLVLPEARGRLRNGAYALQWWIFAAFAVVMTARIARDIGRSEIVPRPTVDAT